MTATALTYEIRYNRSSTLHITGLDAATPDLKDPNAAAVTASACPAISRNGFWSSTGSFGRFATLADAMAKVQAKRHSYTLCKRCSAAAERVLAS